MIEDGRNGQMMKITKAFADRVDIEISGSIDAETMRTGLDELISKSEDVKDGRMLYTISDFSMPTMAAFGVEFARLPKLFSLIGKFDKCAVVSDTGWVRTAAEIEGKLFPGIEIRSFEMHDLAAAETWLARTG
jgi:hypothetical protein